MLTEAERLRRNESRKRNEAAKKARREQRERERELIKKNLLQVLESEEATPAERLESSKLLLELEAKPAYY